MGLFSAIFGNKSKKVSVDASEKYEFINPHLFSGYRLKLLKYLFIHIPEKEFDPRILTGYLCDSVGAKIEDIFKQANVTFVTESDAGDIVQETQKLPDKVPEHIGSLFPEVLKDRKQYPFVVRTFDSELEGRYGLFVLIYDIQ